MEGARELSQPAMQSSSIPSPTERGTAIRVWDPFVRVFHWLLVAGIAVNYFELVKAGRYPHRVIGYIVLGLIAARLVWGFIGSRHARFASFVEGPKRVVSHLKAAAAGRDRRFVGHNPAGGAMIVALLSVVILVGATGWLSRTDWFFGVDWMEDVHGILANVLIALICVHVLGVIHGSWRHRENLVLSMLTGWKRDPERTHASADR